MTASGTWNRAGSMTASGTAWTEEQRQAINAAGSVIVSAAAGSGKTAVLVEHYIEVIRAGASVDEVAAVTFTEKAAAEMRARVTERLTELAGVTADPHLGTALHAFTEGGWVTTIHGLCRALLAQTPLQAGVPPAFSVLDRSAADVLRLEAAREAVDIVSSRDEHTAELVASVGIERTLQLLMQTEELLRTAHVSAAQARSRTEDVLARLAVQVQEQESEVHRLLDSLADYLGVRRLAPGTATALHALLSDAYLVEGMADRLLALDPEAIADLTHLRRLASGLRANSVKPTGQALREALATLIHYAGDLYWSYLAPGFFTLLAAYQAQYAAKRRAELALDFADLEEKALQLLQKEKAAGLPPRFRHVMVDEFQDTNRWQWQIIQLLAGFPEGASVYLVGDPKQSIYRFRGAEVAVFAAAGEQIDTAGGRRLALSRNFRSRPELIDLSNHLFAQLLPAAGGQDGVVFAPAVAQRQATNDRSEPSDEPVELLLFGGDREQEAAYCASAIAAALGTRTVIRTSGSSDVPGLEQPLSPGDIAVLFRAIDDAIPWQAALLRRGVPYVLHSGRGFYALPEVLDGVNLLRWLAAPRDEVALAALLRSPFCAVSDTAVTWIVRARDRLREEGHLGATLVDALFPPSLFQQPGWDEQDRRAVAETASLLRRWLGWTGRRSASGIPLRPWRSRDTWRPWPHSTARRGEAWPPSTSFSTTSAMWSSVCGSDWKGCAVTSTRWCAMTAKEASTRRWTLTPCT